MRLRHILLAALAACSLAACDNIEEDERFLPPVDLEIQKNVLVEDFTGQRCVNCPLAATAVADLQQLLLQTYSQPHVISVAIHGGSLALDEPAGLANALGKEYNNVWGISTWPSGLIDRMGAPESDVDAWKGKIFARLALTPQVTISMDGNAYEPESRTLTVKVDVESNVEGKVVDGKLQVWLTESGIIGYQAMPGGSHNMNYEHNHVLRATLNSTWGEDISVPEEGVVSKEYTYQIPEGWNTANMAVVAFVCNDSDGVLQVVDTEVEPEQEDNN